MNRYLYECSNGHKWLYMLDTGIPAPATLAIRCRQMIDGDAVTGCYQRPCDQELRLLEEGSAP